MDAERCKAARSPDTDHQYRLENQLAWGMIQSASACGMDLGWITLDTLYGSTPWQLHAIDDLGKQYVADVRSNQRVYPAEPKPKLKEPRTPNNRKSTKPLSDTKSARADKIFHQDDARKWRKINQREVEFLSDTDIIEMLGVYLSSDDVSPEKVYRNIKRKHKKRRADIEPTRRARQRKRSKLKEVLTK